MNDIIECAKCGTDCQVDGEFPKFFAWCDVCNDYAQCDMTAYAADYLATRIDAAYEQRHEIDWPNDSCCFYREKP